MSYQEIYAAEVAELLQQEKLLIIDQRDMAARSKGQAKVDFSRVWLKCALF